MDDEAERRLTAIMFTDVVGFTALGQENESVALGVLESYRNLLRPLFARHRGHEVKTMGDGFLVEFGSALEAALCAIDIQSNVHSLNLERGEKLLVRIGIHLGDVIHQEGDLLGDAVNVASRIEPLARPGGICISGQVYDHVKNKVSYPLAKLPTKELKNVREPIDVYKVVLPWEGEEVGLPSAQKYDRKRVAVLPLVSLSPDPDDEFFADGVTEELVSTMSSIAGLQVISRTSVMHFKKTTKTMLEIAGELMAGSILEGSVRKAGNRVRVTVQLIDSNEDAHVWASNYDRQLDDVFAIQSDISMKIADALKIKLLDSEKERVQKAATNSPEAHLLYLKGRYFWNERSEEGLKKATQYFGEAIEEDPNYALAYSGLADTYSIMIDHGYSSVGETLPLALSNAQKAVELDGSMSETHASLGLILGNTGRREESRKELRRAIELNPNNAYAHLWYALATSDNSEAVSSAEKAVELDPLNLQIGSTLGSIYYRALRTDEAIAQLKKVTEMGPDFRPARIWLALAYLENGQPEEAIAEARVATELRPNTAYILGSVLARGGNKEEAQRIADEAEHSTQYVDPADLAWLQSGLGAREKAVAHLQRAITERSGHLQYFAEDPYTREFRKDPEIRAMLEKAGFREE